MAAGPIVFLCSTHDYGGTSFLAERVCEHLKGRGIDAQLWFLFDSPGVRHDGSMTVLSDAKSRNPLALARLAMRLHQELRRTKPQAVFGLQTLANLFGAGAGLLAGVPARIALFQNPPTSLDPALIAVDRALGSIGLYTRVIACSRSVAEQFKTYPKPYRERLSTVVNGWNAPPVVSKQEARRALGLPQDATIIGQLGRFSYQKNQALLVEAMSRLGDVDALFVGTGPDRAEVEALLRERGLTNRARIVDQLSPQEIGLFFGAIDIICFPSRFEGLSLAAIEALHAGVPMLASDIPSFHELFATAPRLLREALLPLDAPEAWADAIRALRDDPDLRAMRREDGLKLSETYSLSHMADQYLQAAAVPPSRPAAPLRGLNHMTG